MNISKINDMLSPSVVMLGYEFVGCEYIEGSATLRVYIDSEQGITVDDCATVSRQVSAVLDVEDPIAGEYNLEVSSPGLNRPLFQLSHYEKYIGQCAKVRLKIGMDNRRNFKGIIQQVTDSHVSILVDGEPFELNFDDIERANIVPDIKK